MTRYTDRVIELLIKTFTGKLTFGENAELSEWLEADAANREMYERLSDGKHIQDQYDLWMRMRSSTDGWEQMQYRMARSATRRRRNAAFRRLAPWLSAAAVVVVGMFLTFRAFEATKDSKTIAKTILHPNNMAVVELDTGEVIALDGKHNEANTPFRPMGRMVGDSILDYGSVPVKNFGRVTANHTLKVPEGAEVKRVILSDGTTVWLNAGSSLVFPVAFEEGERVVQMTGEGYFEVQADRGRPFIIKTQGLSVRVTGTSFNLMSYPDDGDIETTLVEGMVDILLPNKSIPLTPGAQAVFDKTSGDMTIRDVDTGVYTAWKDGWFGFKDMPISDICHVLSRWYDVDFRISDSAVGRKRFTGTIDRKKSLGFILDRIRDTQNIDYEIEDGEIIIMSN